VILELPNLWKTVLKFQKPVLVHRAISAQKCARIFLIHQKLTFGSDASLLKYLFEVGCQNMELLQAVGYCKSTILSKLIESVIWYGCTEWFSLDSVLFFAKKS